VCLGENKFEVSTKKQIFLSVLNDVKMSLCFFSFILYLHCITGVQKLTLNLHNLKSKLRVQQAYLQKYQVYSKPIGKQFTACCRISDV
jgi:hypothetical protein